MTAVFRFKINAVVRRGARICAQHDRFSQASGLKVHEILVIIMEFREVALGLRLLRPTRRVGVEPFAPTHQVKPVFVAHWIAGFVLPWIGEFKEYL